MLIMNAISIITRFSKVFFDRKLHSIHVSFSEQLIIMYLISNHPVNQENIVKHFMIDKGAIAKTLAHLEEKGLILRTDNPDNRREKLITLTDKAGDTVQFMGDTWKEWNDCLFDGVCKEDMETFQRVAIKISENATTAINRM